MMDVSKKNKTLRTAKARVFVKLDKEIAEKIKNKQVPKGDVLECARIAGILAAKNTPNIIPLCHPIGIEKADVEFTFKEDGILLESVAKATAKTGVEMEALCACAVAALTVYDMVKAYDKGIVIKDLRLLEKRGGKSGVWTLPLKDDKSPSSPGR